MGHQVNYYATPADVEELDQRIRDRVGRCIILERSSSSKPQVVETPEYEVDGRPLLYFYLIRPDELDKVVMKYFPTLGCSMVDGLLSPVVEFDRCFFDERELRPGRLYYVDGYYTPDATWVYHSDAFLKWAQAILRIAKKTFVKQKESFYYIGHDAMRWLESSNGKLGL